MRVSVLICAYTQRRWSRLREAVASLEAQTRPPDELLLVIDHEPELLARAREAWPQARVLANAHARGLSGARNTGVEAAAGDVVAFLDDDAQAGPDWLTHLERAYGDDGLMAAGGTVEPVWPHGRPPWFPPEFDWVVGCTHSGMPGERASVRNLVGANMSFRRDVLLALGGFSERLGRVGTLPAGCEETELCIRARQRWPERTILYLPEARVRHSIAPERATKAYFAARCREEGRSKALVRGLVGPGDGLAAERAYVRRTLPAGVLRGLLHRDLGRPAAIVAGLALTAGSYVRAVRLRAVPCGF